MSGMSPSSTPVTAAASLELLGHELGQDEVVEERLGAARRGVDEEADAVELTPTEVVLKHVVVHRSGQRRCEVQAGPPAQARCGWRLGGDRFR